jgi:hypothetical protein
VTSDFHYFVEFRATVRWRPADETHHLDVIAGARRGPGWYVFTQSGCVGRIVGPLAKESDAERYRTLV